MKAKSTFRWFVWVALLTLIFFGLQTAFAASPGQVAAPEPPSPVGLVDVLLIGSIVAFFKARFPGMPSWGVLVLAGVISLILALAPRLELAFPFLTGWFGDVVTWFKLFIYATGGYDLLTEGGPKVFGRV